MKPMRQTRLFHTDLYKDVEGRIIEYLNSLEEYLTPGTAGSPRAVGDAIQHYLAENFDQLLGKDLCAEYSTGFARRAMADLAFEGEYEPDDTLHGFSYLDQLSNYLYVAHSVDEKRMDGVVRYMHITLRDRYTHITFT